MKLCAERRIVSLFKRKKGNLYETNGFLFTEPNQVTKREVRSDHLALDSKVIYLGRRYYFTKEERRFLDPVSDGDTPFPGKKTQKSKTYSGFLFERELCCNIYRQSILFAPCFIGQKHHG